MTRIAALRRFFALVAGGGLVACTMLAGIDDFHVGECKGGKCERGDSSSPPIIEQPPDSGPAPVVEGGAACPGKEAPKAIRVGSGDNTFCIDTTEVSVGQYREFLDAKVATTSQPPVCAWNKTFEPFRTPLEIEAGTTPATDLPVTQIDWCDALAYCTWAGKYLCGRVEKGKKLGPVTTEGLSDYQSHQWMLACSAEARLRYPYGGVFDPSRCNVKDLDAGKLLPVGSLATCVGGFEGLHDMVGNAWEYFDGPCKTDAGDAAVGEGSESDLCMLKGASYLDLGDQNDCHLNSGPLRRDFHGVNVGFRCCSD
jgi:formylglycine-generating enzyme required for sulfatase activity